MDNVGTMNNTARAKGRKSSGSSKHKTAAPKNLRSRKIRILIVDRRPVVRSGLESLLRGQPDFQVVGVAATCVECERKLSALDPNIMLVNLQPGNGCAFDALNNLRNVQTQIPTIVISENNYDRQVVDAMSIGIKGYLVKETSVDNLLRAIRAVARGESFLDPAVHSTVMRAVVRKNNVRHSSQLHFSDREKAILRLLVHGKSNQEIAEAVFVSTSTVKYHVSSILTKLRACNRTEAVALAVEQGLVGRTGSAPRKSD